MRPRTFLLIILLLFTARMASAQRSSSDFWDRIVVGGSLGAQFGNLTVIQVAPNIGYQLTEEWIAGIGMRYYYLNDKDFNYKTDIYGGSIFSQYYFLESFVAHGEVEMLNREVYYPGEREFRRVNVTSVLVGGGVRLHAGGNTYFTILGLWNLNESFESPYVNPIIRAGIAVGL